MGRFFPFLRSDCAGAHNGLMNDTPDDKPAGETDKRSKPSVSNAENKPRSSSPGSNTKQNRRQPVQAKRKARVPPKKPTMSQQTLGYVIFGFGVLAFLGVGILVYQTYMGPSAGSKIQQQAPMSLASQGPLSQQGSYKKDSGKKSKTGGTGTTFAELKAPLEHSGEVLSTKEAIKHKKGIRTRHITGSWSAALREAKAILWVDGNSYQLIIDFDYPALASRYSQGTYVLNSGMMLLQPQPEWGKPQNITMQPDKKYNILTRNEFSVLLSRKDNALYWIEPPSNKKHRFFAYRPEGVVQWTKIR